MIARKNGLRRRSAATATAYRQLRRPLVISLLTERPWCEIRWDDGCTGRAVDVDEIRLRSQGGSLTDLSNLQVACRHCHDRKHANPTEARERGFTRHAGDEETPR